MKKGTTLCMGVLQCLLLLSFAMCAIAQNQPKENSPAIPKPEEIGQFFALRDGVLTPLQEEKNISSYDSFPAGHKILKIKMASSSTVLDSTGKFAFVVHLPDKSILYYSLRLLKQEKDQRTFRPADGTNEVSFSTSEYADGYYLLTPKSTLSPGQYVFFLEQNMVADFFYSFAVK
jgi:hypothetical protein